MLESYITVKQDGFSEIEIKKSRFICSVKRVTSEEEAISLESIGIGDEQR